MCPKISAMIANHGLAGWPNPADRGTAYLAYHGTARHARPEDGCLFGALRRRHPTSRVPEHAGGGRLVRVLRYPSSGVGTLLPAGFSPRFFCACRGGRGWGGGTNRSQV